MTTQLLDTVKASPIAVAAHDKEGWLGLFTADAVVLDPVGTAACNGTDDIARFYDTFIAATDISFESSLDLVCGNAVVRDVTIQTRLESGIEIAVPALLLYEVEEESGELKIASLNAYWELRKMIPQVLGTGLKGYKTMLMLSWKMFRIQGLANMIKYSDGMLRGIFDDGKGDSTAFSAACGDSQIDFSLRTTSDFPGVEIPGAEGTFSFKEACQKFESPLQLEQQVSAGFHSVFVFKYLKKTELLPGVGVFEYDRSSRKINRARLFY